MRAFMLPLLPLAFLAGCSATTPPMPATPPVGLNLGPASSASPGVSPAAKAAAPATNPAQAHAHHHGATARVPGDVPGHGTIEAIDPGRRRVTLAHDPMPEIGWPAMTMVFPIPTSVDPRRFKPGDHIDFTLRKGISGSYDLIDMRPGDH